MNAVEGTRPPSTARLTTRRGSTSSGSSTEYAQAGTNPTKTARHLELDNGVEKTALGVGAFQRSTETWSAPRTSARSSDPQEAVRLCRGT
jgi:hypothetical protein